MITAEQFNSLLTWLDADRDGAGVKYEVIRSGLVRVFVSKGLNDAEDLADETINRVIARLGEIQGSYCGDPARYFHGVARNIILETRRRREVTIEVTSAVAFKDPIVTIEHHCLDLCLDVLPPAKRDLILDYYLYEGHDKIRHHKQMAKSLGVTEGALRGRAHHIRVGLDECVKQCVRRKENKSVSNRH